MQGLWSGEALQRSSLEETRVADLNAAAAAAAEQRPTMRRSGNLDRQALTVKKKKTLPGEVTDTHCVSNEPNPRIESNPECRAIHLYRVVFVHVGSRAAKSGFGVFPGGTFEAAGIGGGGSATKRLSRCVPIARPRPGDEREHLQCCGF